MQRATRATWDIRVDGTFWRLIDLAEWEAFQSLEATSGIVWRDADATKHRLLAEQGAKESHVTA